VGVGLDGKTYTDRVAAIKALSDAMAFKGTERCPLPYKEIITQSH